jgi:hypothetical protein
VALVGAALVALAVLARRERLRSIAAGLLVSYVTLLLLGVLVEGFFRFVYYDTAGRRASENWLARYWRENSSGYRDREWNPADYAGKVAVAVVGDSFAAGWGVNDPADRFSDVLAARLGDAYYVFNLAVPGTSTPQQLEQVQAAPVTPQIVILQYFLNDIDRAVMSLGLPIRAPDPAIGGWRDLHTVDFVASLTSVEMDGGYWAWEYANYDNYVIWDVHRAQLEAFVDYTERIGARLIVVIFPNMTDPVGSIPYVDRVAFVFEGRGVEVLKLFDEAAAWGISASTVAPRDGHANSAFHRRVGEMLYAQFFTPNS